MSIETLMTSASKTTDRLPDLDSYRIPATSKQGFTTMQSSMLIADFVVATVEERDFELDRALTTAKFRASMDRQLGVLVTRHDFCRFSVSLTASVPYGTIHECDHAQAA